MNHHDRDDRSYHDKLESLQIELVKMHRQIIKHHQKLLIIFEGRDASGKDGTIKRFAEHLSPRETRIVALPKPSNREETMWYFQRYVPHLPAADEIVLFNRSWYNRAGVERVMGFCSRNDLNLFFNNVIPFETMLISSGISLFKFYLDISKDEQKRRLADRAKDPFKQWKLSPIDAKALEKWDDYSLAQKEMFQRTSTAIAPWYIVKADDKRTARLNIIRHVLYRIEYQGKDERIVIPDDGIIKTFESKDPV